MFTLAIAWVLLLGTRLFSRKGSLVHKEFKISSVSCALSLVVTNTPGTTKVLGTNLIRPVFFSNGT